MDESPFLRIFSKNFFMSSSTRLDRAYKNAMTLPFDEDSKFIELRDADIEIGDAETEVFVIKTGDNEDNMHIEIDVQGDGANPDNRFHVAKLVGDHFGSHKIIRKHMRGNGKHAAKMVKKLIKKGEFSQEQLDEIQQLLSEKEAKVD